MKIKQIDPPEVQSERFAELHGTVTISAVDSMPKEQDLVIDDITISQLTNYNRETCYRCG